MQRREQLQAEAEAHVIDTFRDLRDGTMDADLAIARSGLAPEAVLVELAHELPEPADRGMTPELEVFTALAQNPRSTEEVFLALLDKNAYPYAGYEAMAEHPNATPLVLGRLASKSGGGSSGWGQPSHQVRVRASVAGHPNTPRWLLARLASDSQRHVRAEAIQNPRTPAFALARAVYNERSQIGEMAIADRFQSEIHVLETVFRHVDRYGWAAGVSRRPYAEDDLLDYAENPAIAPEVLEEYAQDPMSFKRRRAAKNPGHPVIRELLEDEDPSVRAAAVEHPSMDPSTMRSPIRDIAENDPDETVREAARGRAEESGAFWARGA